MGLARDRARLRRDASRRRLPDPLQRAVRAPALGLRDPTRRASRPRGDRARQAGATPERPLARTRAGTRDRSRRHASSGSSGVCIALAAVVALVVYALLEYVGSRESGRFRPPTRSVYEYPLHWPARVRHRLQPPRGPTPPGARLPELEARTKIRPKYLRALEDERFDILPAPTYVKGFLRSYAEALGLDGQPFVDEYSSRFAIGEDEVVVRARRAPAPRRDRTVRESRMAVLALLGIAVLTALVIAAWRFGGPENEKVHGLTRTGPGAGGLPRLPAGGSTSSFARSGVARGWRFARDRSPAGSCTAERSSAGSRSPSRDDGFSSRWPSRRTSSSG